VSPWDELRGYQTRAATEVEDMAALRYALDDPFEERAE